MNISDWTTFPDTERLTVMEPILLLLTFFLQMIPAILTELVVILQLLPCPSIFDSICYYRRNTWHAQAYHSSNRI